jgi:hypothetical protein
LLLTALPSLAAEDRGATSARTGRDARERRTAHAPPLPAPRLH